MVNTDEYISESTKLDKGQLRRMIENNTLPKHLREVFEEAKSWWHFNSKEVLIDNYHTHKAIIEDSV